GLGVLAVARKLEHREQVRAADQRRGVDRDAERNALGQHLASLRIAIADAQFRAGRHRYRRARLLDHVELRGAGRQGVNELHVLAHELPFVERLDLIYGLAGARDVHRNRQPEFAGIVDFRLIYLRLDRARAELAAPGHAERDEALVRPALPIPGEALDRSLVRRLGVGQALRPTAGMAGADADLGEGADIGFGVGRAAHVVAPGVHEGHSVIDRLRGREPRALKDVIRTHLLAEARDGREIAFLGLVAGE